jgi:hypothetical protein
VYISGKDDVGKRRVFDHPGLRVMAASPAHIFAMKALAARTRPTKPCRSARTSIQINPYPNDPLHSCKNFSARCGSRRSGRFKPHLARRVRDGCGRDLTGSVHMPSAMAFSTEKLTRSCSRRTDRS